MTYLNITNLRKEFRDTVAVSGIELSVESGELFCLLGPNGAGKTTILRMLSGITEPTSGEIIIGGKSILDEPHLVKSDIYFIPDRPYLYEKLSAREYLEFLINVYGRGSVEDVKSLLEEFEILHLMDRMIETFSHGMRQKLLLTAAFLLRPRLLLVDEPMVGLDPRSSSVLRSKLVEFVRDGSIAIISTHQISLVEAISSRVAILHKGDMLADGTYGDIVSRMNTSDLEAAFLEITKTAESEELRAV